MGLDLLHGRAADFVVARLAVVARRARLRTLGRRQAERLVVVGAADVAALAFVIVTAKLERQSRLDAHVWIRQVDRQAGLARFRVALRVCAAEPRAGRCRLTDLAGRAERTTEFSIARVAVGVAGAGFLARRLADARAARRPATVARGSTLVVTLGGAATE